MPGKASSKERKNRPSGTSKQALARALPGISGKTQLRKAERLQHTPISDAIEKPLDAFRLRWCWRAADGSWIKTHKWAAQLYLGTEHKLSKKRASNSSLSTIDRAMSEAARSFRVDLAGDYYRDKDIQNVVDRFYQDIPIDRHGVIRSGEYKLPDGRRFFLTNDAQLGLVA